MEQSIQRARDTYYHSFIERLYRFSIPVGKSVIRIEQHTSIIDGIYDYIVISHARLMHDDIQELLVNVRRCAHEDTRIILEFNPYAGLPLFSGDIRLLCQLADLQIITYKYELLMTVGIPVIADFCNYFLARLPLVRNLCVLRVYTAHFVKPQIQELSVSVIIPCRNEAGNIEGAITRTPLMGSATELIFVEGHSRDATISVLEQMKLKYPEKKITWFTQSASGKKNAVEQGFAQATGDILMILDADLTVTPEELPKFYAALASGKGECINGSRLVYPMERQAMPFLNWIVNYVFGIIISFVIGQRVKDTLCGTKVFFKKDLDMISLSKGFFGDVDPFGDFDILCGAAHKNLKIIDVPVHYKQRTYGTSQVAYFKNGVLLLKMVYAVVLKLFLRR